jgi:hypothetical protein
MSYDNVAALHPEKRFKDFYRNKKNNGMCEKKHSIYLIHIVRSGATGCNGATNIYNYLIINYL